MADDNTYAPKSPDLSSLYSGGPTVPATELNLPPQQSPPPEQSSHHPHQTYKLESPPYGYGAYAPPPPIEHQQYQHQHHQPHPHLSPTAHPHQLPVKAEYHQGYPAPIEQHHQPHHYLAHNLHAAPPPPGYDYGVPPQHYQHAPYDNPLVEQPPYLAQAPYAHPYPPQAPLQGSPQLPPPHNIKAEPPLDNEMPPRRAAAAPAPVLEPSPVKTKFPTARIKRIMQADEEVGKVAQQTPIAVGKALEMFMVQMVTKSAEVAKDKGSKRVSAQMLKQVVETDEQWDFLREIVGRVENEKEGGRAKKVESESEEEVPEPKKKARGGRRKKD